MPNKKCVKLYTNLTHSGNAIRNNLIIPYLLFLPLSLPLSLPLAIKVAPKKLLKFIYTTVDYIKHYLFIKQDLDCVIMVLLKLDSRGSFGIYS